MPPPMGPRKVRSGDPTRDFRLDSVAVLTALTETEWHTHRERSSKELAALAHLEEKVKGGTAGDFLAVPLPEPSA